MFNKRYLYTKKIKDNKKGRRYLQVLNETLELLEEELDNIRANKPSEWDPRLLQNVVYPEMKKHQAYAEEGKVFLGTRIICFRRLDSIYFMLDNLDDSSNTPLGRKLLEFDSLYCNF